MPVDHRRRLRVSIFLTAIILLCILFAVWNTWQYVPGTYFVDNNGHAYGTGRELYFYDSGELRLVEEYQAGILTNQIYYQRDGEVLMTSPFDVQKGGVGYTFREDGSIRTKVPYRFIPEKKEYFAHGNAEYYAEDGTVEKVVEFQNGVEIKRTAEP
ncbi:toxin-antitoxin system YwqK family antitoxin [Blastopirellula marina]|uniref:Toxin-antitoxin system YwqK family antitoxin n=1 Tax=Blastopirellula marina TaxID=124 RepID=A0A2S8GNX2_9BACT|nr:hypothetical protein [Blastopirellula marina]PQO46146.1 hypothetical protein C5Y93_09150 [Blastopirellula marina]